jgi:hypothetical protein
MQVLLLSGVYPQPGNIGLGKLFADFLQAVCTDAVGVAFGQVVACFAAERHGCALAIKDVVVLALEAFATALAFLFHVSVI